MRVVTCFKRNDSVRRSAAAVLVSLAVMFATSTALGDGRLAAIKQALPQISQQVVTGAKLAIGCVATVCILGVASPAVQADQNTPTPAEMNNPFIPFDGSWYMGAGGYTDSFGDFATFDVGFKGKGNFHLPGIKGEKGNADLLFLTSFRAKPEEVDTLDAAQILPVTYGYSKVLLFDRGQGKLSYGYSNVAIAALMNSLWAQHARNYALYYQRGPIKIALLGHEYFDNILRVVETDDPVRGSHVSLYRGGIEQYIPLSQNVLLQAKLESSLGLGDVAVDLGGVRQDRLEAVVGAMPGMAAADIDNALYHEGSARLTAILDQGRYIFFVNVLHGTTIDGIIEANDTDVGDFSITNDGIEVFAKIKLTNSIALEGIYGWYGQDVEAKLNGIDIVAHESKGHLGAGLITFTVE